jgi:hypothetical protein
MKNSRGRFVIFLFLFTFLYSDSSGFEYHFDISNPTPYKKEPITLTLDIAQSDHTKVMLFKFDIQQSRDYDSYRIDTKSRDEYHNTKIRYTYLIYPLKEGRVDIRFDLIEMITTDEKVAYSFSGDRDNTRGLNKKDISITLPPQTIEVKPLPKEVDIVGDFKLSHHITRYKADSYEPLPLRFTIKGRGYPPILTDIIPPSNLYSIFEETPIVKSINHKGHTQNKIIYNLALSAEESFELEPIIIRAFNPSKKSYYELKVPRQSFQINRPNIDKLVDSVDNPKSIDDNLWGWVGTFMGYLVVFMAGFVSATLIKTKRGDREIEGIDMESLIDSTKNQKELLALLLATDRVKYKERIEKLEDKIYR